MLQEEAAVEDSSYLKGEEIPVTSPGACCWRRQPMTSPHGAPAGKGKIQEYMVVLLKEEALVPSAIDHLVCLA